MSELYSSVQVVDCTTGEELVRVKVPGVPRNDHVLLVPVQPNCSVEYACRLAALRAKRLAYTPACSEAGGGL